ncbi:MAG: hypothetical protein ACPGWS_09720 [Solirubrobacterales bacterium]
MPLSPKMQFHTDIAAQRRRVATCEEVECVQYRQGVRMNFTLGDATHEAVAQRVRESGRLFGEFIVRHGEVEVANWGPFNVQNVSLEALRKHEGERVMLIAPGQKCFEVHTVPVEPPRMRFGNGTREEVEGNRGWVEERDPAAFVDRMRETTERTYDRATREGVAEMIREGGLANE